MALQLITLFLVCICITSVTNIIALEFPDVSRNQHVCGKELLTNIVHQCTCEPYKPELLTDKPSLVKFHVSFIWHFIYCDFKIVVLLLSLFDLSGCIFSLVSCG
jgi:hypothetical protein